MPDGRSGRHGEEQDTRSRAAVHSVVAHRGGAVNDIESSPSAIVSSGADTKLQVLEARNGFQPRCEFAHHKDFIYSLGLRDDLVLSGGGDGLLLVHDLQTDKLLYGLGASEGAVRAIGATERNLVVAGDDGNVMLYDF